jgi:hypothetical protein
VSLTCEALEDGTESWWLTGESGRGPICWEQDPYTDRTCGGGRLQALRKSYLVLKAALGAHGAVIAQRWKYVAIAELDRDSLQIAREQVLFRLRRIPSSAQDCTKRGEAVQHLFSGLAGGLFSMPGHACTCAVDAGIICPNCRGFSERRFVVQDRFRGHSPHGAGHWFSGFTDAVGDAAHMQLPWLRCCCGTAFPTCIMQ